MISFSKKQECRGAGLYQAGRVGGGLEDQFIGLGIEIMVTRVYVERTSF